MMKKLLLLNVLLALVFLTAIAQTQHSGWLATFQTYKLKDKWSLHFDGQLRSTDELKDLQTLLLRTGLNFNIKGPMTITAGYAFASNLRTIGTVTGRVNEHRIWEQFLVLQKWNRLSIAHRFRLEQRFLPQPYVINNELENSSYVTSHRFRYFLRSVWPLKKQQPFRNGFFAALQNEVFLNIANLQNVNNHTFDQNRFYAAFGYRLPKHIDLEAGYMNQYTKTTTSHTTNHILQLAVYRRL
jgi:hypothetical protein